MFFHQLKHRIIKYPIRFHSTNPIKRIGFIGLGNMGLPMCLNLLKKRSNEEILVYDTNPQVLENASKEGANKVLSLKHLETCDLVFTSLPSCESVTFVYGELLSNAKDSQIFVDTSTISPSIALELHEKVSDKKCFMLDAPVSGGVKGSQDGTLTFMVGGLDSTIDRVTPYFQRMGKHVFHCGAGSSGSVVKLCNNLALASQMIGIVEAMSLGDALGVNPKILSDVINQSTGGCWSAKVDNPHPAVGEISKARYKGGFASKLMLKDLGLACDAAEKVDVPLLQGKNAMELYRLAAIR